MTTHATGSGSLADAISDMEDNVRNVVRWGQVLRTMGTLSHELETGEVYVVAHAVLDLGLEIEREWERCFNLSGATGEDAR